MKPIRNAVKAIIRRDDTVLMIRCAYDGGVFYILPGGGQEPDETMHETARRECREEIGCAVEVGPLLYVCEYVGGEIYAWERGQHQIEFMFQCTLAEGEEPRTGLVPDELQDGIEWVAIDRLDSLFHYPKGLAAALRQPGSAPVYWGNVKQ